jgi:hypothetical protein
MILYVPSPLYFIIPHQLNTPYIIFLVQIMINHKPKHSHNFQDISTPEAAKDAIYNKKWLK